VWRNKPVGTIKRRTSWSRSMLETFIREILNSNLGQDIDYPEFFHGSPQSFQANAWIALQLGQDCFLQNPFQFINHPDIRSCVVMVLKVSLNNPQKKNITLKILKCHVRREARFKWGVKRWQLSQPVYYISWYRNWVPKLDFRKIYALSRDVLD
jgi:hypothetical protein